MLARVRVPGELEQQEGSGDGGKDARVWVQLGRG